MERWLFTMLVLAPSLVLAQDPYPLEPADTTSPRGTLTSFLESANESIRHWQRHGDDPGTGFVVTGGFAHQLVDGLVSKANEISEQLAPEHEIRSEHFWNRKRPQTMADVFQNLIREKGGIRLRQDFGGILPKPPTQYEWRRRQKGGCPLRITGRADASLFAAECE